MATGHLNPGYGNIVTGLRRSRSAVPGARMSTYANNYGNVGEGKLRNKTFNDPSLQEVHDAAKRAWSSPQCSETSYQDHFRERNSMMDDATRSRPTSANRRNKPHPPLVFLTCALHTVPGYHNPDAVLGKDVYKVDAILPPEEQQRRIAMRKKYQTARPSSAAVLQYAHPEGGKEFAPSAADVDMPDIWRPRMRTPATAQWERDGMNSVMRKLDEEPQYEYHPPILASHHRYLRPAGFEESMYLAGGGQILGSMHATDRIMARNSDARRAGRTRRGDFLMHPEWPPNFTHHRLNGLSAPDIPYSTTKR